MIPLNVNTSSASYLSENFRQEIHFLYPMYLKMIDDLEDGHHRK